MTVDRGSGGGRLRLVGWIAFALLFGVAGPVASRALFPTAEASYEAVAVGRLAKDVLRSRGHSGIVSRASYYYWTRLRVEMREPDQALMDEVARQLSDDAVKHEWRRIDVTFYRRARRVSGALEFEDEIRSLTIAGGEVDWD